MDIQLRLDGCKWIGCDADPFASKFFTSLDEEEQSKQVNRMGDNYRLASLVIVWLGVADGSSESAFRLINNLTGGVLEESKFTYLRRI